MVDAAEEEADLESSVPPDKMLHLLTLLPKIKSILFYLLYTLLSQAFLRKKKSFENV